MLSASSVPYAVRKRVRSSDGGRYRWAAPTAGLGPSIASSIFFLFPTVNYSLAVMTVINSNWVWGFAAIDKPDILPHKNSATTQLLPTYPSPA